MADIPAASTIAYCDPTDLQLGDITLPASVSATSYIIRASRDIDLALGERYQVPILTGTGITNMVLRNVAADLASAYILFSLAQPSEGNVANAYATVLYQRAAMTLEPYRTSKELPGALLAAGRTDDSPVSVVQEDAASLLGAYETFVTTPNPYAGEFYGPWSGRYGDGFQ